MHRQQLRNWTRWGFFALFVLAPPLDIFRLDLTLGHFVLFGQAWTLGLDPFLAGEISGGQAALNLLLRAFLPIACIIGLGVWVSWRYGRLYCGWLCPHFSVVEVINDLMRRTFGRPTLWERKPLPEQLPNGRRIVPNLAYWPVLLLSIISFAFLWALSLLSYLLPPWDLYHNIYTASLTRNQSLFLGVGTLVFSLEFLLARHLFCRFGCAIGLFQSLVWMANKRAMVVSFDRSRVADCIGCTQACDNACPMRLKPRSTKRHMFTCTQCSQCLQACEQVQAPDQPLLRWELGVKAEQESASNLGMVNDTASDARVRKG